MADEHARLSRSGESGYGSRRSGDGRREEKRIQKKENLLSRLRIKSGN